MRVTIQYQETRKPHAWKDAFPGEVLYADSQIILVRACGSHSSFHANGQMRGVGYNPKHPHAKNIPARHGRWRIEPTEVPKKTLRLEDKAHFCVKLACALLPAASKKAIEDQAVSFMLLPDKEVMTTLVRLTKERGRPRPATTYESLPDADTMGVLVEHLSTQRGRRPAATRGSRPAQGKGSKGSPSRSAASRSASKPRHRNTAACRQATRRPAS